MGGRGLEDAKRRRSTGKPKYQKVEEGLKAWIADQGLDPGDRLPTEAQLAERFAVSRLTVRHAVGNMVHQGLLSQVQGRGTFYLGSGDKGPASKMVAVVVTYINDYIFPDIIHGIEARLNLEGYAVLLLSTGNDSAKEALAIEAIRRRRVDGLILEPTRSMLPNPNLPLFGQLVQSGIPMVMVHANYDGLSSSSVEVNDMRGGALVAEHLSGLGHRDIGSIIKMDDKQGSRRLQGFIGGLSAHGIVFDASWCQLFTTESKGTVAELYAQRLAKTASDQRPSAVFCYNDEIAVDLIGRLYNLSLSVPGDVSVVGFDDADLASAVPAGLTTVTHPKADMGMKAAEMILEAIAHRETTSYVFDPVLVTRGTTKARALVATWS